MATYDPYQPDFTPRNIVGTDGDDTLRGAYGNDTFQGGLGSDSMEGDMGNDTYVVRLSDAGQDTIGVNMADVIDIQDQVNPSDLVLRYQGTGASVGMQGTLYIGLRGANGQPDVLDDLTVDVGTMGYPIAGVTIRTGTGQSALLADLLSQLTTVINGTDGYDNLSGFEGRDVIHAGAGNDYVRGLGGDDQLFGGSGNDELAGEAGNNLLDGGAGNDYLKGDVGNDTLQGGDGDDLLSAGGGKDTLSGGAGSDTFFVDDVESQQAWIDADGSDFIEVPGLVSQLVVGKLGEFGAGTVALRSTSSPGYLLVLQNATNLQGLQIIDTRNGLMAGSTVMARAQGLPEAGIIVNTGGASATLTGSAANEELVGALNADTLRGGAGNDTLYGSRANDDLDGGLGNDLLDGGADHDLLRASAGNDTLIGGRGNDVFDYTNLASSANLGKRDELWLQGTDTIRINLQRQDVTVEVDAAQPGNQVLVLGANGPRLSLKGVDDPESLTLVQSTAGWAATVNQLRTGSGSTYLSAPGNDNLVGSAGNDLMLGGMGDGRILGGGGNDTLSGGDGDDTLEGGVLLNGGAGNDVLRVEGYGVSLYGGEGDDTLTTDVNAKVVDGGEGADLIRVVGTRFGDATQVVADGQDTLELPGLTLSALKGYSRLVQDSNGLILHFNNGVWMNIKPGMETTRLQLADGQLTLGEALAMTTLRIYGSDADDTLVGGAGNDEITGGGGANSLSGGAGNDSLYTDGNGGRLRGEEGNDQLVAWSGDHVLDGGVGNDFLQGGPGNGLLLGGEGNDALSDGAGQDTAEGGDGNDSFFIAAGNDLLIGGAGVDTYLIGGVSEATDGGVDTLVAEAQDVVFFTNELDLNTLVVSRNGLSADVSYDTQVYTASYYQQLVRTNGTLHFDDVTGLEGMRWRNLAGDSMTLAQLLAGERVGVVRTGNDVANAWVGTLGNDTLSGGAGQDTLRGGAGDDLLNGGAGADTFVMDAASLGHRDVLEVDAQDTVRFEVPVNLDDIDVLRDMNAVLLTYKRTDAGTPSGGQLVINDITGLDGLTFQSGSATRTLADVLANVVATQTGSSGSDTMVGGAARDVLYGLEGDDKLDGGAGQDTLYGGAGNDLLSGGAGNDLLVGGAGHDTLNGGAGADTYRFETPVGADLDRLTTVQADAQDTLQFEADVDFAASSYIYRPDDSLELQLRSAANASLGRISLSGVGQLSGLTLVDGAGEAVHPADLLALARQSQAGTSGIDTLTGFVGQDYIQAEAGNDVVNGLGGHDTLSGGAGADLIDGGAGNDQISGDAGNDTLTGGAGADLFAIDAGGGQDLIHADGLDTLSLGGFTRSQLGIGRLGAQAADSVLLSLGDTSVLLDQASTLNGLNLMLGDGSTMAWADVMAEATKPLPPVNQTLTGTAGKDTLTGGAGKDTLSGLAGNDILSGGQGDDVLNGGKGNDTYLFARGDGHDTLIDKDSTWFNSDALKIADAKSSQLWFTRTGNSLDIAIIGTTDKVTVQDWFANSANRIEKITALGDNKTLNLSKLNTLVSAMAGFTGAATAGTELPANTPAAVSKLVASSWVG